ncbi:HIS7 [Symbiodinium sp. CCMP2592]|nr:HIS7 [Symbiodinium sp. CCMP2592]
MNPPRRQTGVMRFLTEWWSQQHQVVLHDESPKLPPLHGEFQTQLCCVLNFCVCSGRGQVALFFHKNLASLLRPHFVRRQKVTPPGRSALDDALLVMRFSSSYSSSDAASYLLSLEDDAEPKPCPGDVWYHLSYMNLTTFHCTLLPLRLATEGQSGPGYNLVLPPDAAFQSSVEQFSADIDFDFRWQVHFFTVSRSEQLGQCSVLPEDMAAANVHVVPLAQIPSFYCWQGATAEAARRLEASRRPPRNPRRPAAGRQPPRPRQQRPRAEQPRASGHGPAAAPLEDEASQDASQDELVAEEAALWASASSSGEESEAELSDIAGMQEEEARLGGDAAAVAPDSSASSSSSHADEPAAAAAPEGEADADAHSVRTSDMSISSFDAGDAEESDGSQGSSDSSSSSSSQDGAGGAPRRAEVLPRREAVPELRLDIADRGSIRFNTVLGYFRAICTRHPNCTRQRTSEGSNHPSRTAQGRPLGFLAAWLLEDTHVNAKETHPSNAPSLQSRARICNLNAVWKSDSIKWREQLQISNSYAPWTARPGTRLAGVPKQDRVRDLIDLCCADVLGGHVKGREVPKLLRDVFVDVSQSHARKPKTRKCGMHPCLTTSSTWYSYRLDRMLVPHENFLLQGHSRARMLRGCPVMPIASFQSLAGEGFAVPCIAAVLATILEVIDFRGCGPTQQ